MMKMPEVKFQNETNTLIVTCHKPPTKAEKTQKFAFANFAIENSSVCNYRLNVYAALSLQLQPEYGLVAKFQRQSRFTPYFNLN